MDGQQIVKSRDALKSEYMPLTSHMQELSQLYMPFDHNGEGMHIYGWDSSMMFDSTPRQAAGICVNGLCSLVAPRNDEWFEWSPPVAIRKDEQAIAYYRECTEIARAFIDASNFYEEFHSAVRELVIYGTGNLFCGDLDERGELYFRMIPMGSYYFAENVRGRPTEVYRDLFYTAKQAADEFGEDKLPKDVKAKLGKPEANTERHEFVHAVYKRKDAPDANEPEGMKGAWKSCTVHAKSKQVVKEETFAEFPFAIGRYERFPRCVWGFGPGSLAKGDSRQLNFLNELADLATEKSVFPPVEAPAGMEGEIALGALEVNYRPDDSSPGQIKEIQTAARFDVAFQRLQDKREQVNKAFFVDLFTMFALQAQQPGQITAYQASQMAGEKLTQFSPIFGRLVSEKLDVALDRVFGGLFRAGMFPPPPPSVAQVDNEGKVRGIAIPSKLYKNRIVLAQQAKQNHSILEFIQIAAPMIQLDPTAADGIKLPDTFKRVARNNGVPEDLLRSEVELKAVQAARAEAAQQQQRLANAETASKTAANLSKAGPVIGQIGGMM
jgi:hypothetical protein